MIKIAKLSDEERSIIFNNVAYEMGVNAAIVEKDYWVSLTLFFLFSKSSFRNSIVFKGGTCLSKVYKVIERFSEDIDLILDWRLLGYKTREPWEDRSNTKQLKFIEESKERLFAFLKNEFLPKFRKEFSDFLGYEANVYINEDDAGIIYFDYPKLYTNDSILKGICLEIGALAEWIPQTKASLTSYVADYYPLLFDVKEIQVNATTLERTFWEKVTILHQEANRPENSKLPSRYSRHYYDVYCIGKSGLIVYSKETVKLLESVANFKSKFYPRNWARYDLARIGSLKLAPNERYIIDLKEDYKNMQDMIYGAKPSFEEIVEYMKELEKLINNLA